MQQLKNKLFSKPIIIIFVGVIVVLAFIFLVVKQQIHQPALVNRTANLKEEVSQQKSIFSDEDIRRIEGEFKKQTDLLQVLAQIKSGIWPLPDKIGNTKYGRQVFEFGDNISLTIYVYDVNPKNVEQHDCVNVGSNDRPFSLTNILNLGDLFSYNFDNCSDYRDSVITTVAHPDKFDKYLARVKNSIDGYTWNFYDENNVNYINFINDQTNYQAIYFIFSYPREYVVNSHFAKVIEDSKGFYEYLNGQASSLYPQLVMYAWENAGVAEDEAAAENVFSQTLPDLMKKIYADQLVMDSSRDGVPEYDRSLIELGEYDLRIDIRKYKSGASIYTLAYEGSSWEVNLADKIAEYKAILNGKKKVEHLSDWTFSGPNDSVVVRDINGRQWVVFDSSFKPSGSVYKDYFYYDDQTQNVIFISLSSPKEELMKKLENAL